MALAVAEVMIEADFVYKGIKIRTHWQPIKVDQFSVKEGNIIHGEYCVEYWFRSFAWDMEGNVHRGEAMPNKVGCAKKT